MNRPAQPVRDAATVMLVRDRPTGGMEVFMLKRHLNSDFVGGAYVFPGGKVDDSDRADDLGDICSGRTDAGASRLLGIEWGGLAYWVAAVRECFEEAGVLLASHRGGGRPPVISLSDPSTAERFAAHRRRLNASELGLLDMCRQEDLIISADRIHYFAHWITPRGAPRRFDTRFFVAAAPPEQVALHDDYETVANMWVRPHDALALHAGGELDLILPTIKNLEAIGRFERSEDLLSAAEAIESVPTITPRISGTGEGVRILLPGDLGYDQALESGVMPQGMPLPGRPGGPEIE